MRASRFFGFSVLRPQTVIREPACPFRAQTDLLTMHYSLKVFELKGQVGKFTQMTVCGRNEEERPALSSHAHTTNERRCTTRASRLVILHLRLRTVIREQACPFRTQTTVNS